MAKRRFPCSNLITAFLEHSIPFSPSHPRFPSNHDSYMISSLHHLRSSTAVEILRVRRSPGRNPFLHLRGDLSWSTRPFRQSLPDSSVATRVIVAPREENVDLLVALGWRPNASHALFLDARGALKKLLGCCGSSAFNLSACVRAGLGCKL